MTYPAAHNPFPEPRRLLTQMISLPFIAQLLPPVATALEGAGPAGVPLERADFSEQQLRHIRHQPPQQITLDLRNPLSEYILPVDVSPALATARPVWAWNDLMAALILIEVDDPDTALIPPGALVPTQPPSTWQRCTCKGEAPVFPPALLDAMRNHGTVVTFRDGPSFFAPVPSEDSTHD